MDNGTPVSSRPRTVLRHVLLGVVCVVAVLAVSAVAFGAMMKPDVKTFKPMTAGEGATVTITGADLSGATSVKFGGVSTMHFKVKSATSITATVPKGAKKGPISVTTAAGTSASMEKFTPHM